MLEILDNLVTQVLTVTLYAAPIAIGSAFTHFVATSPVPSREKAEGPEITAPTPAKTAITCAPVDWQLWPVKALRAPHLRKVFDISVRTGGKVCRRDELIAKYEDSFQQNWQACPQPGRFRPEALPHLETFPDERKRTTRHRQPARAGTVSAPAG